MLPASRRRREGASPASYARLHGFVGMRGHRGKIASSCVAVSGTDAKATDQLM
jgi:hypothetical protein